MKKLLLILTRKYPYAFGEPFLESELSKHIPYYDKIIVLAQDVSANEEPTRVPPTEVDYYATATGKRRNLRARDMMHIPIQMLWSSQAIKDECSVRKLHLPQKAFLSYFESRCQRVLAESEKILDSIEFEQYDQITIYSYWLFANANVSIGIKEYLQNEKKYLGRILLVSRAHRYDIYEEVNKVKYLPYRKRLLENMDYVFPCSKDGADYIIKNYSNIKAKVEVAYLGTRDYGLAIQKKDLKFHIVSCSRVVKVKGLERLIDELALLKPSKEEVIWTHIGGGVEGKTKYFEFIQNYAQKNLCNISFEFLGMKSNTEVYQYYKDNQIDLFINVSYSEGLPVSLMEASSFGIPVIATNVGGSSEIIDNEKNGFLLEKDFDKGQLANKIECILNEERELREARRNAARKVWEEKYNAEINYAKFAHKLSQL